MPDAPDDVPPLEDIGDGEDLPGYWTERTTITVRRYTKQRLDDDRDGQPWDEYLESLRRQSADPLTMTDVDAIANRLQTELDLTEGELDTTKIAREVAANIDHAQLANAVADEVESRLR